MRERQNEFVEKQPREHHEGHLKFTRGLPCVICHDNTATEAAHIRYAALGIKRNVGLGEKPDDRWVVPLCSRHHRWQHQIGEREFWLIAGIDPIRLAIGLWECTGDQVEGERLVMTAHDRRSGQG